MNAYAWIRLGVLVVVLAAILWPLIGFLMSTLARRNHVPASRWRAFDPHADAPAEEMGARLTLEQASELDRIQAELWPRGEYRGIVARERRSS